MVDENIQILATGQEDIASEPQRFDVCVLIGNAYADLHDATSPAHKRFFVVLLWLILNRAQPLHDRNTFLSYRVCEDRMAASWYNGEVQKR